MLRALVSAVAILVGARALACENPPMVTVPDGRTATEQELLQAQEAVRAYLAAMQDYLVCVQEEQIVTGENAPSEYLALMVKRQHAAIDEMEAVAALYNEQLTAYRSAHPAVASSPDPMPSSPFGTSPAAPGPMPAPPPRTVP
jgi:hypothetical protein